MLRPAWHSWRSAKLFYACSILFEEEGCCVQILANDSPAHGSWSVVPCNQRAERSHVAASCVAPPRSRFRLNVSAGSQKRTILRSLPSSFWEGAPISSLIILVGGPIHPRRWFNLHMIGIAIVHVPSLDNLLLIPDPPPHHDLAIHRLLRSNSSSVANAVLFFIRNKIVTFSDLSLLAGSLR